MMSTNGPLSSKVKWGLVIHGGVGVLSREALEGELEVAYLRTLEESLKVGYEAMKETGSAEDGVVEAIRVMEDSDLFNAGRGSNFTTDGEVSMDASIMVGDTLAAGAVAGVRDVRNPISLARRVMDDCPHVMLSGRGAEAFAREMGIPSEDPEFFFTQRRWNALQAAKDREGRGEATPNTVDVDETPPSEAETKPARQAASSDPAEVRERSGTVGAVALDQGGTLVAGTSTGGSANKKWGRIGDSPVIAAGTYAGSHCGVSCTGWGEYFIRHAVAHDVQARMAYQGLSLRDAAQQVIWKKLESHRKGLGGIVAMDRDGNLEMCYNTQGMYRGWVDQEGRVEVAIF